jgi:hypothetical protein
MTSIRSHLWTRQRSLLRKSRPIPRRTNAREGSKLGRDTVRPLHHVRDWPKLVPYYEELYRGRTYLGSAEGKPVRKQVSELARRFGVADRRVQPLEPEREPEQLELAV